MTFSESVAESRRSEAREKFGEREVLNPVSWRSYSAPKTLTTDESAPSFQSELEGEMNAQASDSGRQQNWILWVGGGIFVLGILAVVLSIN